MEYRYCKKTIFNDGTQLRALQRITSNGWETIWYDKDTVTKKFYEDAEKGSAFNFVIGVSYDGEHLYVPFNESDELPLTEGVLDELKEYISPVHVARIRILQDKGDE